MTCAACRNIPAFAAKGYELQGSYEVIAGVKTCTYLMIPYEMR